MEGNVSEKRGRGRPSSGGLNGRALHMLLAASTAVAVACALILTFTVGDYYIFNRISEYGFFFCLSQWFKKAGLVMITLAVFFGCRSCADAVKYTLPVFIILSCCLYGDFFDVVPEVGNTNDEIFNSVNLFIPGWLNVTLFFLQNAALAACCGLFIVRDGLAFRAKSFIALPLALLAALPLNIFENFFDMADIPQDSFLRFGNFTIWHFLAVCALVGATVGAYLFLRNKSRALQDKYLAAVAVCLLLQYHSKDSVVMGDGYNVYRTVWACLPLFICNIGVYIASASVIFKKKFLYSASFFVHAVGALTVFVYFGKDEMSNYGIFCSYSILYFCLTHCLLFVLCVLPSALGHYRFKIKDCVAPLIYYFTVIVAASVASGLVSSLSAGWTASDGSHLFYDNFYVTGLAEEGGGIGSAGYMRPNYAFTQVNPLPLEVPWLIKLGGFMSYINVVYVLIVYVAYVCLFFAFYGLYRAYLAAYAKISEGFARRAAVRFADAAEEAAAADSDGGGLPAEGDGAEERAPAADNAEGESCADSEISR